MGKAGEWGKGKGKERRGEGKEGKRRERWRREGPKGAYRDEGSPNQNPKYATVHVLSQCTPGPDGQTNSRTDEHRGNSATIRRSNERIAC